MNKTFTASYRNLRPLSRILFLWLSYVITSVTSSLAVLYYNAQSNLIKTHLE